ncbi:MAG: ADP-ribosylglycohydrolase family protein [Acetobacteraceae bacterium]|nr:ADP-ribosylglycohydrolase family protein [Acetobacteraceae bacterium]
MTCSPAGFLPQVIEAVQAAGAMLSAEFCRPQGPRFTDRVTAPVDREIELFLRERLLALLPARFVGEEAGVVTADTNGFCWVVDPHDGTRAFLEGRRGSAVSVALLRQGKPVLGVVFAPLSPDRGPDLIAWAEGVPLTRNGEPVTASLHQRRIEAGDVVFLNHGAWQRPVWNSKAVAPGRFMPLPSIAYRLARVAVGDGVAAVTLRPVNALDIAAGHALLLAAGGVLVAEDGAPVTYSDTGDSRPSACFGGALEAVATLRSRQWRGSTEPVREPRVHLAWPRAAEDASLDRAIGCLLGQVIGDSLGAQVEFRDAAAIARSHPGGVRDIRDGGTWDTLAGQPTDDSELALALARTLAGRTEYDAQAVAEAYRRWFASRPFDCGNTTARALLPNGVPDRVSQANGSLMRVSPIGIWAGDPARAAAAAMADSALTHPHPVCQAACSAYASAIAAGIRGADRRAMMRAALNASATVDGGDPALQVLRRAAAGEPCTEFQRNAGWVLTALHNAFFHLAAGGDAEDALIRTVSAGGDTDTNGAIAGALLGAAEGRRAFPARWVLPVLTCRADAGLRIERPRPEEYWADDLVDLAEALLLSRRRSRESG